MNYCASPSFAPGMVIERIKSLSKSKKVILFIGEIFLYWLWLRDLGLDLGKEVSKDLG